MAKVGKLTKLKSAFKRLPSLTKHHQPSAAGKSIGDSPGCNLRTIYVGKSRRKYQLNPETINHPVLQELVDRSSRSQENQDQECVVIACEVVLFEHLLWMLSNKNNHGGEEEEEDGDCHSGSMEELIEFYTNY